MEHLFAGWRAQFVTGGERPSGCVLCAIRDTRDDDANYVVARGAHCYVVLNLYPYTSGHMMVVPHRHTGALEEVDAATSVELVRMIRAAEATLRVAYDPGGINIGVNLGRAAGAGIEEHLHVHVVPRWSGDANFMATVANTRVLPEALPDTLAKLRASWRA
jgi:ATP adenylyltransferase